MFEQESYDKATVQAPPQEAELFKKYEIKSWELSPAVYKILAASAVLHIAVITFMAQTNILTMRGCDSPWVGSVCQVVDMAYVGAMLYGTDREFVDEAYENIDLGEAEITYIDVTGETPPISYPEGYFQIANPVQYAMLQQMAQNPDSMAGFPGAYQPRYTPSLPNNDADLLKIRPNPPTADPNAFKDDSSPLFKVEDSPSTARVNRGKGRGGKIRPDSTNTNTNQAKPDDTQTADKNANAQPAAEPTDKIEAVTINRQPMNDFADSILVRWMDKGVDFSKPFTVELNGYINNDGKLDKDKSKWDTGKETGDPVMIEIAKQSVEMAVNSAGWFGYLRNLNVQRIKLTLHQNENEFTAVISSEQASPERARTVSSGMNGLLVGAKITARDASDEKALLEGATVTADGRNFVMNFKIPKQLALEMIDRNLKAAMARKQSQPQPNSLTPVKPENNTAIK